MFTRDHADQLVTTYLDEHEIATFDFVELLVGHTGRLVLLEQATELLARARVKWLVVPQRVVCVEGDEFDHQLPAVSYQYLAHSRLEGLRI